MNDSSYPLHSKVIFIQGAGRSPGPQLARTLAAQGAIVAACDLSPNLLAPLEEAGKSLAGEIRGYVGDLSRGMPARALLDEVSSTLGAVDILITNPRITPQSTILKTDEWDWHYAIDANLNGPFLLTHLVGHEFLERGSVGVIIHLIAAPTGPGSGGLSSPGHAAYAASQMGLLAMTRAAAQEFMAYNILVYGVCLESAVDPLNKAPVSPPYRPGYQWTGEVTPQEPVLHNLFSVEELVVLLCGMSSSIQPLQGQVFHGNAGLSQE